MYGLYSAVFFLHTDYFGEEDCMIGDGPELSAQGLTNLHRMEQMLANGDAPSAQQNGDTTHHQQQHGECSDSNGNIGLSSFVCVKY